MKERCFLGTFLLISGRFIALGQRPNFDVQIVWLFERTLVIHFSTHREQLKHSVAVASLTPACIPVLPLEFMFTRFLVWSMQSPWTFSAFFFSFSLLSRVWSEKDLTTSKMLSLLSVKISVKRTLRALTGIQIPLVKDCASLAYAARGGKRLKIR